LETCMTRVSSAATFLNGIARVTNIGSPCGAAPTIRKPCSEGRDWVAAEEEEDGTAAATAGEARRMITRAATRREPGDFEPAAVRNNFDCEPSRVIYGLGRLGG
jgi:hypothetical protein